ncbi:Phosphatidylserine/phosphatidylglycerophosphate/cardiolipin synthase [Halomicrobium zhouii]|uniref:Phosphatidylserine/phosphatidylglycerophosphate/cardiolipin synthase n=1 Tax=Halomicrobium zhouii TaxID=767519 RepID=A0A1I6KS93_9EURY|nr:phospholipase D-like domain-containing protein [Halomicrobium zhouii]SFR94099.1 Phosphatidylserine/phosphatidylglycerophosphate/cardiolipin synthase [Halomicrobium zhouii]
MRRLLVALVLVSCLPATAMGVGALAVPGATPVGSQPVIVELYPNPIADEDAGEYAVVSLPSDVDPADYVFTDGEVTVSLANASAGARVAVANDRRAANLTDHSLLVDSSLSLANGGEEVWIERNGTDTNATVVHERRYRDAPEGEVATWNDSRIRWRQIGATDRPVVRGGPGRVRAFVLPDSPGVPVETLRDADRRILLAGYTLVSDRVVDALTRAHERGVTVRVLLEGEPVGGRMRREADLLDRLAAAGVDVRLVGGEHARYDYHHAKYAVVDDRAVVMTENWKPAGTGGNSSRGWGVVTDQPRVVDGLEATFRADAGWRDAKPWDEFRRGRQFERGERSVGEYPTRFESTRVGVDRADLLVAPDNAQDRLVRTIDSADDSVDVVQVTLGDWDSPLVVALRRAARCGVDVRLLLGNAWYNREDNQALADRFDEWASDRDVSLTAKLAEPGNRYEKIHAKGAVIDDDRVVLGSLNWNEQAATSNREVILLLYGDEAADYYGEVFDADWNGGKPGLPVGLIGAVVGCLIVAGLVVRRLEFEG